MDMQVKTKSVLDGVPVDDKAFPLRGQLGGFQESKHLQIVGKCSSCGAPIYGDSTILENTEPHVKYSCKCWRRQGTIEQQMEKK